MPYCQRDEIGQVIGLFAVMQDGYASEFLTDDDTEVITFLNPLVSATPTIYALALAVIVDGEVVSIEPSAKIIGGFKIDAGVYEFFFTEEQEDNNYVALCYNHDYSVYVSSKGISSFTVSCFSNGVPSDPSTVSIEIKRVI